MNWYAYCGGNPLWYTDPWGLDWFDDMSNTAAGWGDALTFGMTGRVRMWLGVNDVVDEGSGWYIGGQVAGTLNGMALLGPRGSWKSGSHKWGATRSRLGRIGFAKKGEHMHHWFKWTRQASWLGKRFPGLTNQTWNLVPMSGEMHRAYHAGQLTALEVAKYAVPAWAKREAVYLGGLLVQAGGKCQCP